MINITPTFINEFYNTARGIPEGYNTNLSIPFVTKAGKKSTLAYKDKPFIPNPVFPVEL